MSLERLTPKPFMTASGKRYSSDAYTVRISHGEWHVEGISKEPFNFKLSGKYADLFSGLIPGAEILQKTGDASLTTGIFSQKYFQGGNNLDMGVNFRIYDDGSSDINPVTKGARNLANMAVADQINLKKTWENLKEQGAMYKDRLDKTRDSLKSENTSLVEQGAEMAAFLFNDISDRINQRVVTLQIMNMFFCSKMAIQDVSVTYSTSQTHSGPLFGDFSVSLISLQALTRGSGDYGVNRVLQNIRYNITIDGLDAGVQGPIKQYRN